MVGYPAGSGITVQHEIADIAKATQKLTFSGGFFSYRKPQAKLVEEKSRSVETVEKEPPFAIIRSG